MSILATPVSLFVDEDEQEHPAYNYFREAMLGKSYGREEVRQAWAWFKEGWESNRLGDKDFTEAHT